MSKALLICLLNPNLIVVRDDFFADVKPKRRFAEISEEQLQTIIENKKAVNKKRSTNQAVKIFREYLALVHYKVTLIRRF
jgi:hypothetical protein